MRKIDIKGINKFCALILIISERKGKSHITGDSNAVTLQKDAVRRKLEVSVSGDLKMQKNSRFKNVA